MKDYYRMLKKDRPLPVRWMAIESIEKGVFTSQSDVVRCKIIKPVYTVIVNTRHILNNIFVIFKWSFGVVLWELYTRGGRPYSDVNNYDLKMYLKSGRRLDKPETCPPPV